MNIVNVSAPMTNAFRQQPDLTDWLAITKPYIKPEQAAFKSKAAARQPRWAWTMHAVEGVM